MTENRLKVVYLKECEIASVLNWMRKPVGSYLILSTNDCPDDVHIERVFHSPINRAMAVMVSHESFPETLEGQEIPRLHSNGDIVLKKVEPTDEEGCAEPVVIYESRGITKKLKH